DRPCSPRPGSAAPPTRWCGPTTAPTSRTTSTGASSTGPSAPPGPATRCGRPSCAPRPPPSPPPRPPPPPPPPPTPPPPPPPPAPGGGTDTSSAESPDFHGRLIPRAERAARAGNTVRAAIVRTKAARVAPAALTPSTRAEAEADLQRLVVRLQAALQLDGEEAA